MSGHRRRLRSWPQITFRFHDVLYPVQWRPATAALIMNTGASDVTRDISKSSLLFRRARGHGAATPRPFLRCCPTISRSCRSAAACRAREQSPLTDGSRLASGDRPAPEESSRATGRSSSGAPVDSIQGVRRWAAIVLPPILLRDSKRSPHRRAARVLILRFRRGANGGSGGRALRLSVSRQSR